MREAHMTNVARSTEGRRPASTAADCVKTDRESAQAKGGAERGARGWGAATWAHGAGAREKRPRARRGGLTGGEMGVPRWR